MCHGFTLHLCLKGCGHPGTYIQVGTKRLVWPSGQAVAFDDSYLHRARVDPQNAGDRWIFHIMVMHPQINTPDRFNRVVNGNFGNACDAKQNKKKERDAGYRDIGSRDVGCSA